MRRIYSLGELRCLAERPPTALAIGVFDGAHLGHMRLFERARQIAAENAAREPGVPGAVPWRAAVFTFQAHPLTLLRPAQAPSVLSTLERRLDWMEEAGLDLAAAVPFDAALAEMEALEFLREIVAGALGARRLLFGPDFRFGRGGAGDERLVREAGAALGIEAVPVAPAYLGGEPVSSSRIRRAIREGRLEEAEALLGRPYEIEGVVEPGRRRGRELGYPTANLRLEAPFTLPPTGVYAIEAETDTGLARAGMMNIGYSPTFGDIESPRIEAHLFDFSGGLLDRRLRIRLLRFLRPERRFGSIGELTAQLRLDETEARRAAARNDAAAEKEL